LGFQKSRCFANNGHHSEFVNVEDIFAMLEVESHPIEGDVATKPQHSLSIESIKTLTMF
jgi:hypothetical protein